MPGALPIHIEFKLPPDSETEGQLIGDEQATLTVVRYGDQERRAIPPLPTRRRRETRNRAKFRLQSGQRTVGKSDRW